MVSPTIQHPDGRTPTSTVNPNQNYNAPNSPNGPSSTTANNDATRWPPVSPNTPNSQQSTDSIIVLNMQGMIPDIHSKSFWKLKYLVEEFLNKINKRIPFLALTETWLKSHIKDAQIAIPQYQIVRADREGRERGGALLYIHEDFTIIDEQIFDNNTCEMAVCTLKPSNIIVASIYRPPDATDEKFSEMMHCLQEYINQATSTQHLDTIIMGDFNLPCISWEDITIQKGHSKVTTDCAKTLLTFMEKTSCHSM